MNEYFLVGIASIIVAGVGAQWLAWRFKWPAIVLLLALGFLAGPITGLIKPDEVLGPLLFPLVSLSVAVILFEGGLSLRLHELKKIGATVLSLITVGVLINGALITFAAHYILGLNFTIAALLGSILIVTGPTVIIPLLRHVRPLGQVGNIIKWEGIVIDPIGAALAVLVFEYITISQDSIANVFLFFFQSIAVGAVIGFLAARVLLLLLRKYWIPDYLHGTMTLMFVMLAFILSNMIQRESGLFAVIAMGMTLANQHEVGVRHIISFKENLGILIISTLFIILGARIDLNDLRLLDWNFLFFLMILIFMARPLSVFVATLPSRLNIKEKLFVAWMAPRGIVAAAIVSIFAFKFSERGIPQTEYLVPITLFVIMTTVLLYGTSSAWVAQYLGLAGRDPQGVLILGAHRWARLLARKLREAGIKVILVDSNHRNVIAAQKEEMEIYEDNILDPDIEENIDLEGIGRLFTFTSNDEANSLAVLRFRDIFGRSGVYQLSPGRKDGKEDVVISPFLRGRYLFNKDASFDEMTERFAQPGAFQVVESDDEMNEVKLRERYGASTIFLFSVSEKNKLIPFTVNTKPRTVKGDKLFVLYGKDVK